jgi:hypothetical protein
MANAISLDLSQFKSSGVYTIEIDNTQRVTVTTQSLRLVVGYSGYGIHNAPVFLRSTRDLKRFYGDIDKKAERKGSFFHRGLDTCLQTSPVFALSLLKVDDTVDSTDTCGFAAFSVNCASSNYPDFATGESALTDLFVNFFNRERFWKADPEYLQGVVVNKYPGVGSIQDAPLFQIANVGTKSVSLIIRKAVGISGYGITAKDFYGSAEKVPYGWIRPYDLLKDYFVQVIAVEGDWTNYSTLSTDPYFSTYFNSNGLIYSKLNEFINLRQINLIGSWTGCIIPDFKDQNGSSQYIEDIINNSLSITGLFVNVNNQALDQLIYDSTVSQQWELGDGTTTTRAPYLLDLIGHNLIDMVSGIQSSFLSYDISVADADIHLTLDCSLIGSTGKIFYMSSPDASGVTIGTYIKVDSSIPGVTYVESKLWNSTESKYKITTAEPIYEWTLDASLIYVQKPIDDSTITTHYKLIKLPGLTLTNNHAPGYSETGAYSVEAGVEKIYSMLYDTGVFRGLTNTDMIQYRYIVDTMAYGLQPLMGGKSYLSKLAKARGKTTALLNAPSMQHFASSTDPYFCDTYVSGVDPKPIFNTQWIPEGGNPDMQRTFRFTLPDEEYGSKYCGVFGPFLKYNDEGKTILVPPAADISNTYIKKFLGGNPYVIVANKNGIISNPNVLGVEYPIDKTDRDYLEPFGYNSIIERPSTGEIMIYANATAYQNIKSDYNYLHVRELLNTIEIQVEEVLKNFVFDLNNPVTRLNVINSVAPILEGIKNAGALDKYELVMDDTNNTDDIIRDGYAIIDIGVWITKGMQKIINRVSLNANGGVSSGGFALI